MLNSHHDNKRSAHPSTIQPSAPLLIAGKRYRRFGDSSQGQLSQQEQSYRDHKLITAITKPGITQEERKRLRKPLLGELT